VDTPLETLKGRRTVANWQIDIPHRSRDESVVDVLCDDLRAIEDRESRAVARAVLQEAAESGTRTVGEVMDRLNRADPAEVREMLDRARVAAGLETTADVEGHAAFVAANRALVGRKVNTDAPPEWARPRLAPGGGIEFGDQVERERVRAERKDRLRAEADRQRRAEREIEAAERAELEAARAERWKPSGPGWDSPA
jgi:hypothetical protein